MSPARILRTLDIGLMLTIASPLRRDQREAVAKYLGTGADKPVVPPSAFCKSDLAIMSGAPEASWPSWGPSAANTRFQTADHTRLDAGNVGRLELKWSFGFAGDVVAFAAPTVFKGTIFVGSAGGTVQALEARTGCLYWQYDATGPVRTAMSVVGEGSRTTLVFADLLGWVYALDARTGKANWKKRIEEHEATRLTGSPAVHDGVAFVPAASWEETRSLDPRYKCCTFRGSITAVRVSDGSVVWKTYLVDRPVKTGTTSVGTEVFGPSGAGVWSSPTVDASRGLLYVTTGDNYSQPATALSDAVLALNTKTGRIVWSQQATPNDVWNSACGVKAPNCPAEHGQDYDFGASAMLVRSPDGRDVLVAGQKSGMVYALDPENNGKILWQQRVVKGPTLGGGVQWGMASDGRNVYAAVSGWAVRNAGPGGPAPTGNGQLDPVVGGGLTALRASDGARVWFSASTPCKPPRAGCSPAQPAAVTAIPGAVFSGSMDGHIRAFSTENGRVLWDFDTERSYTTVNGAPAHGGSLDGAGPVIVGDMVFVNSGYPRYGGAPGNVLLAFGIPEP
jgi:polyvinyl alcohol dehydrogenase (cytochrome)